MWICVINPYWVRWNLICQLSVFTTAEEAIIIGFYPYTFVGSLSHASILQTAAARNTLVHVVATNEARLHGPDMRSRPSLLKKFCG